MTPRILATLTLLLASLPAAAAPATKKTRTNPGPEIRREAKPSDEEISRLLQHWASFDRAMGSLHDAVPPVPPDGTDTSAADAAWAADERIRSAFRAAGTTPEEFLSLYRRIAAAWWELAESEARDDSAAALRREIAALRAAKDGGAKQVLAELERGLASLEKAPELSVEALAVKRRRDELARLFSPEAPPAP